MRAKVATTLFGYGTNVKPTEKQKAESYNKKCNVRYLARAGLEEKMRKQIKEIRRDNVREKRALENIESKDIPADMSLLWEMQVYS